METIQLTVWNNNTAKLDEMLNKVFNELWKVLSFNREQQNELFDIFVISGKISELDRIFFSDKLTEEQNEWLNNAYSSKDLETICLDRFFGNIVEKICVYYNNKNINWIYKLISDSILFFSNNWLYNYRHKIVLLKEIFDNIIQSEKYDKIIEYINRQSANESIDEIIIIANILSLIMKYINNKDNASFRMLDHQFALALINSKAIENTLYSIFNEDWVKQQEAIKKWKEFNEVVDRPELFKQQYNKFTLYA